jgi:hypothetical protein
MSYLGIWTAGPEVEAVQHGTCRCLSLTRDSFSVKDLYAWELHCIKTHKVVSAKRINTDISHPNTTPCLFKSRIPRRKSQFWVVLCSGLKLISRRWRTARKCNAITVPVRQMRRTHDACCVFMNHANAPSESSLLYSSKSLMLYMIEYHEMSDLSGCLPNLQNRIAISLDA